jgi:glycosyltransferase involved in cell wall biosynthesis
VAGDAALIVDPYSVEAIAAGLDRIVNDSDLRAELVARGREQVKRFDWDQSAHALWAIVEDVYQHG